MATKPPRSLQHGSRVQLTRTKRARVDTEMRRISGDYGKNETLVTWTSPGIPEAALLAVARARVTFEQQLDTHGLHHVSLHASIEHGSPVLKLQFRGPDGHSRTTDAVTSTAVADLGDARAWANAAQTLLESAISTTNPLRNPSLESLTHLAAVTNQRLRPSRDDQADATNRLTDRASH